ncbi:MAG: transaldolase family protein [Pseudomonadota bacterium]|nr:transaldolase family protein [Pseudomonadota bacterium]
MVCAGVGRGSTPFLTRTFGVRKPALCPTNFRAGETHRLIARSWFSFTAYKAIFSGPRWQVLENRGARTQRLLWASTGVKNPAYSDVRYIEELIGPDTVNTVPPATLDAFRDHGRVRASLEEDVEGAATLLAELEARGISLDAVTDQLLDAGVSSFAQAYDNLLGSLAR